MMRHLRCDRPRMRAAASQGFATATDLADYLVRRGIPFRDAHEIVGKAVAFGVRHERDLGELSLEELREFSPAIGDDVYDVLTLDGSVNARNHLGGTAPAQVRAAIARKRAAPDATKPAALPPISPAAKPAPTAGPGSEPGQPDA
jgi:argininosuccinate lyase